MRSAQFAMRDDANMAGATVAIASVDGAPRGRFDPLPPELRRGGRGAPDRRWPRRPRRAISCAAISPLRLIEGGAEIDIVWDVFTPDKQRAQRLSDAIAVKGSGDDAWAMIDDAALNSVAAKCADDLAAYLSNTPEAAPASAALSYAQ